MSMQDRMSLVFGDASMPSQEEQAADELMDPSPLLRVLGDAMEGRPRKAARTIGGLAVNVASRMIMVMALVSNFTGPVCGAISGELLDPELVALGRKRERELMEQFGVFRRVSQKEARGKKVRSKWVEDYKGSDGQRIVRSRLVAMEIAWDVRHDTFAGTPPLKAVRLALALAASMGTDFLLCSYDVSVAFYHATLDEEIHVVPPKGED
jgi:hypothetical protein